ncbi:MAG TPA: hypothetical protein VEL28_08380 [Candidatus Binatia bacterium]|nr:hypothetical protein [Candidatus Binatia bacterium]
MDESLRSRLDKYAADCVAILEPRLRAVILYGDATSSANAPITTALLLDEVSMPTVRKVREIAEKWRRSMVAPLLLDDEYLCTSCDVFPLELLALRDNHEVIWGEAEPVRTLVLHREHLRLEVEEQLKGKILHLRQAYIEARGSGRVLRDLLLQSSVGFEIVMRGLLYLDGREHPQDPAEVVRQVQLAADMALPAFECIQDARLHGTTIRPADAEALFERYHDELVALARATNRVTRG